MRAMTASLLAFVFFFAGCASQLPDEISPPPQPTLPVQASPPAINPESLGLLIHQKVNLLRTEGGEAPLQWDESLAEIAHSHSADMSKRDYFDHISPDGTTPHGRGNRSNYPCYKEYGDTYTVGISENIAYDWLWSKTTTIDGQIAHREWKTEEDIARDVVQGWADSPAHNENMHEYRHENTGIGVSISGGGKVFITQNFC